MLWSLKRHFAQTLDGLAGRPCRSVVPPVLDAKVLDVLRCTPVAAPSLYQLLEQYHAKSNTVLNSTLKYEPSPSQSRRVNFNMASVVALSHAVDHGHEHKVTFCSGFALHVESHAAGKLILSCGHTLQQIKHSDIMASQPTHHRSGTLVFYPQGNEYVAVRASEILAALPRSDLVLFSTTASLPASIRSLPVSPYPVPPDTPIRAHFVSEKQPSEHGWSPWVNGTWSKWVKGRVLEYRDAGGGRAEPGTYDALSHLLFDPPPSFGSSGGPIVEEATGAVVGVILGTRTDRVGGEGVRVRGWGVPAEAIFEMFKLPGV